VLQAIARRATADAVVRVRITLPSELQPHLREPEIRQALGSAHYIAAISHEVEGMRRTRLETDEAEGLQPMQALRLYLESRGTEPARREKIMKYAEELMEQENELSASDD
jgi:hypothetical protein